MADHRDRTPGITFTVKFAGQPASYTSPARPEFGWLLRLLEQHGGAEPVALPTLGGTLPLWVFTETLGIPALWIPAANSDNQQHDVNEHYVLRHFYRQIALYADIVASGLFEWGAPKWLLHSHPPIPPRATAEPWHIRAAVAVPAERPSVARSEVR